MTKGISDAVERAKNMTWIKQLNWREQLNSVLNHFSINNQFFMQKILILYSYYFPDKPINRQQNHQKEIPESAQTSTWDLNIFLLMLVLRV